MRNPLVDEAEALILDKNFHLKFLQDFGQEAWFSFIYGDTVEVPEDSLYAKIFPTQPRGTKENERENHIRIYQEIVQWEAIGALISPALWKDFTFQTKVDLNSGDNLASFAKNFQDLIPRKFDRKAIIRQLAGDSDDARDAGYEMFTKVEDYEDDAEELLRLLFKSEKNNIYLLFLRTGYKGDPNPKEFLEYILEDHDDISQSERESIQVVYDAIRDGLVDAFSDAVSWKYKFKLEKAFTDFEFPNAKVKFDERDENAWEVYTYLGSLINYYIENSTNSEGVLRYPSVSNTAGYDYFMNTDDEKVAIPEEYPYPDDIDINYAYDRFSDVIYPELKFRGILP